MRKEEIIINNLDFNVHYQPIVSTKTGEIVSAEALIRVKEQQMSPAEIICYAEENYCVDTIDKFVLTQTCDMIKRNDLMNSGITFHVNLSPMELRSENLMMECCEIVDRYRIPRDCILFELLETKDMYPRDYVRLQELKDCGFGIGMDDYGTGFAGAARMMSFNFDCVKISKEIFDRMYTNDKVWYLYVESIKASKKANVNIVQEGVETAEQYELIKSVGIEFAQGYYINKALSENHFMEYFNDQERKAS